MNFSSSYDHLDSAKNMDLADPLSRFRSAFAHPDLGPKTLYFAGHSLGLMPLNARELVDKELVAWARLGVEGHFEGGHPWVSYHENVTESLARLVGAEPEEVVAMNSLTVNLHLMLVSFYRPTKSRYKILIEGNAFPSDKYAVDSQVRFHGFEPSHAVVELKPKPGQMTYSTADVLEQIENLGDELALVLIGNCHYLSGQLFPFVPITKAAHETGALIGFNLAHGAGNLALKLHDANVDFAVWCSYKYLNSGPGGIAGAFVHKKHLTQKDIKRFEGWWGHDKKSRFKMPKNFEPIKTAEAWQLSNPPILQLAALRASLALFNEAGMANLAERGSRLTGYMDYLIQKNVGDLATVVTPAAPDRGSMLCLRFKKDPHAWIPELRKNGIIADFREPDIIRATPAPLYSSFEDVYRFVHTIKDLSK